jgi:uncharacterized membrane protein YdjX (TVP38/TMEM64 family)
VWQEADLLQAEQPAHNPPMSKLVRLLVVVAFVMLLLVAAELSGLRQHFSLSFVREQFEHHIVLGLLFFTLLYSVGNLIQVPGWVFLAAAVLTLGRTWGGLATYLAAVVSCCASFWILRSIGGDALRGLKKGRVAGRIFAQLDAHPVRSIALLRAAMGTVPPLNVALALSGVRFRDYLVGALIGLPVLIIVLAIFFDAISHWLNWT